MKEGKYKHIGWLRVLALVIPYFIIVVVFQVIGYLIAGVDVIGPDQTKTTDDQAIITFFSFLGTILVIWIFTVLWHKEKFIDLGFHIKNRLKDFMVGILIGIVVMGLAYLLFLGLGQISFLTINFDIVEIVLSIIVFLMVAVMEEVLLRGYILKNFMLSFNKYIALILSSILFSFMHAANPNVDLLSLVNLFLAGILLGLSYIHTRNLWFPIALHLSWNLFQSLFGFNVSGKDFYSVINFKIIDNNLFNGGLFGFEGSIFCVITQIVLIVSIVWYYRKSSITQTIEIIKPRVE